jgi:hypothetical protein
MALSGACRGALGCMHDHAGALSGGALAAASVRRSPWKEASCFLLVCARWQFAAAAYKLKSSHSPSAHGLNDTSPYDPTFAYVALCHICMCASACRSMCMCASHISGMSLTGIAGMRVHIP